MLEKFLNYIGTLKLIDKSDKILLTVSGGIDSVTMLDLFKQTNIHFAIAHCNFQLRGEEANADQQFVEELAKSINKEFHTINFETEKYAIEQKISIQMAARDLRYTWFKKIASENGLSKIAIAHNSDDVVETFLMNIARGTGIKGLTGIAPVKGNIIRPLLFAPRKEITAYVKSNKLKYREDSSNAKTKYKRNLTRHKIIPLFNELNPSFAETIIHETNIFQSVNRIYQNKLEEIKNAAMHFDCKIQRITIDIKSLLAFHVDPPIIYDLLYPYGYSFSDVQEIFNSINRQPGKRFISENYILVKDRESFIIEPKTELKSNNCFIIGEPNCNIEHPIDLKINHLPNIDNFIIPKNQNSIALDYEKVTFPLVLRHWQKGDYFNPLGSSGKKKISDFFTDKKIPLTEKNKIWLLTSANQIIWIIGYQIDNNVRITDKTKSILLIEQI